MGGPARFMGGMSTEKALDFKGSGRRLLGHAQPLPPAADTRPDLRRRQRHAGGARAAAARRGDQRRLLRRRAAPGRRLPSRRADPGRRARAERRQLDLRAVPGPPDRDHGAAGGVQAPRAGAGQAVPAAAELLRPAAAGRDPQPRHQRHRQPPAVRAADAEPAGHLAADHRRRDHPDVHRVLATGPDRPGHRAGLGGRDAQDRTAGAAPVHQPVEVHRPPQRPHRGDVYRARAGDRVRPAGEGPGNLHRAERVALQRQLPGPVHLRHDPAGDDVHVQPELRAGSGGWRPADRGRHADASAR